MEPCVSDDVLIDQAEALFPQKKDEYEDIKKRIAKIDKQIAIINEKLGIEPEPDFSTFGFLP